MDRVTEDTLDSIVIEADDGVPAAFVADDMMVPIVWTSDREYVPSPYDSDDDDGYVR